METVITHMTLTGGGAEQFTPALKSLSGNLSDGEKRRARVSKDACSALVAQLSSFLAAKVAAVTKCGGCAPAFAAFQRDDQVKCMNNAE